MRVPGWTGLKFMVNQQIDSAIDYYTPNGLLDLAGLHQRRVKYESAKGTDLRKPKRDKDITSFVPVKFSQKEK